MDSLMICHPYALAVLAIVFIVLAGLYAIAEIICPLLGYAFGAGLAYRGRAR
jgi:hypothetical protein